jgi:hypothetical protein
VREKSGSPGNKSGDTRPDNQPPTLPKTTRIHSGYTTSLIGGTRPIREKKMATLPELHHLHNPYEEIMDKTTV